MSSRFTIEAVCADGVARKVTVVDPVYGPNGGGMYSAAGTVNAHGKKVAGYALRQFRSGMVAQFGDEDAEGFSAYWTFIARPGSKWASVLPAGAFDPHASRPLVAERVR